MTRRFEHADEIWSSFPELVAGVLVVRGLGPDADVADPAQRYEAIARERLATGPESGLPEIQAWRRAFSALGLAPTKYRCASEALLRRLRTHGSLPRLHPLVTVCNAVSAAFAVPVAAIDLERVSGDLTVRPAVGDEDYLSFGGEHEHPAPDEIVYADEAGHAHARRWTNRQSGLSAVGAATSDVLIVAEGLHDTAGTDVPAVVDALAEVITAAWSVPAATTAVLRPDARGVTVDA